MEWSNKKNFADSSLCVGDYADRGYYSQQAIYFERKHEHC